MFLAIAVACAVVVAVYFKFFQTQVRWAFLEPADWGHTLLVPFISGYFVWLRREELLAQPFRANWLGFPIILVGIAAYIASAFGPSWFVVHHNAQGFALGITIFGMILQVCGWRATKILLFPLAYFVVFGQSISDRLLQLVTERMQDWSAVGAYAMLAVCGVDVDRSGNVISVYVDGAPRSGQHTLELRDRTHVLRDLDSDDGLGCVVYVQESVSIMNDPSFPAPRK